MATNVNQAGFQHRLDHVKRILQSQGLKPSDITTLAYDEECRFPYNNFLFKVELASPATSAHFPGRQPGTSTAPLTGVSTLLVKLSNSALEYISQVNRIENDVAAQSLVGQSLAQAGLPPLVPAVYAWASPSAAIHNGPAAEAHARQEEGGWMVTELKPGIDLDLEFPSLQLADKRDLLKQIAQILKAVQTAALPANVTKFGALTFDSCGNIVSGQSPLGMKEPTSSYADHKFGKLGQLLSEDSSSFLQSQQSLDLDAKIKQRLARGGPATVLADAGVDLCQKCLVHGDFTLNNMLYDRDCKKITALLDFDWCSVSNPIDEFFGCLYGLGCNIGEDNQPSGMADAFLSSNFAQGHVENLDEKTSQTWQLAEMWNTAIKEAGVKTPSDIKGAREITQMMRIQKQIR